MQSTNAPAKLTLPFANSGSKNAIPVASQIGITPGAASLTDGFPPLNMTPLTAGGVPPSGLDMNGILFDTTAALRWYALGAGFPFDGTFAGDSNVAGYPKGARVMRSDGTGYWLNTVDGNTVDPESVTVGQAATAGWVPDTTNGIAAITMTSSNVTLTPAQYGKPIIAISGTLTTNLNLIFPNIAGSWIVENNCTGAYTITCKGSTGTGAVSTPGSKMYLFGDGTNVYALQSAPWYAADTGSVNAYAAIYVPAVTTLMDGLFLSFEAAHANTGASTFSANGTAYPILAANTLSALQGGEIVQYGKCVVEWSAHYSSWVLFGGGGALPVADATHTKHAINQETGDGRYLLSDAGRVAFFAMSTAPAGYLKANGAAISRATYANLYSAIGTTFGVGDGSTTFNLPDLRGEFLRGYDDSRGVDSARTFGSWQKGSLGVVDTDNNGTWCVSTTTDTDGPTAQADVGLDTYWTSDYPNALLRGGYLANSDSLPGAAGGASYSGVSRPSNIALLACIKY